MVIGEVRKGGTRSYLIKFRDVAQIQGHWVEYENELSKVPAPTLPDDKPVSVDEKNDGPIDDEDLDAGDQGHDWKDDGGDTPRSMCSTRSRLFGDRWEPQEVKSRSVLRHLRLSRTLLEGSKSRDSKRCTGCVNSCSEPQEVARPKALDASV